MHHRQQSEHKTRCTTIVAEHGKGEAGSVGGGAVTLTSTSGDIGTVVAANNVFTSGTNLTASSTGSIFVNQTGPVTAEG